MSSFQLPAGLRPSAQPQQGGNDEERAAKAAQQAQREEMKRSMIQAMLETEARERREYLLKCRYEHACAQARTISIVGVERTGAALNRLRR